MVGQNRLWALKRLGRTTAPAVVTGSCPMPATELKDWADLRSRFKDGTPYRSAWGIAIRGNLPLEAF